MTVNTQEVLSDPGQRPNGPAGLVQRVVAALLDSDDDFTHDDIRGLIKQAGIGAVEVVASDSAEAGWNAFGQRPHEIITRWEVTLNGEKIGYITRSPEESSFRDYSTVNDKALAGSPNARLRDAVYHIVWHAGVPFDKAQRLAKMARVEESTYEEYGLEPDDATAETPVHNRPLAPTGSSGPYFAKSPSGGLGLAIPDVNYLTPRQWDRVSQLIKQRGYDSRGGEDAKRAVEGFLQNPGNPGMIGTFLADWIRIISSVVGLHQGPRRAQDPVVTGSMTSRVFRRAVREWGLTDSSELGGYIMPNGLFLDLSGGSGRRAYDHREAIQFLDEPQRDEFREERGDGMKFFQSLGAIRWMPEGPGIHIEKKPTPRQLSTISRIVEERPGESIYLDVGSSKWGHIGQEYPGSSARRIPQDILHFYRTGNLRPVSAVMKFHATEEAVAQRWVERLLEAERKRFYRPLPIRDRRAHAKRMAENPEDKEIEDLVNMAWAKGPPPYDRTGSVAVATRKWLEFNRYYHHDEIPDPMNWGGERNGVVYDLPYVYDRARKASFSVDVELSHDAADYQIVVLVRVHGTVGDKAGWDNWSGTPGFVLVYNKDWSTQLPAPIPMEIPEPIKTKLAKQAQLFITRLRTVAKIGRVIWPESLKPYTAESLVQAALGEGEQTELFPPPDDPDFDPEKFYIEGLAMDAGVIEKYRQIGGDFGDPWLYGGTWYSGYVEKSQDKWDSLIHIEGLEGEGLEDYDTWSKAVKAAFDSPEHQEEYRQRLEARLGALEDVDPNGHEDEDLQEEMKQEIADFLNTNRKLTVYRTNCADEPDVDADMLSSLGMSAEEFAAMPAPQKAETWAGAHGWHELDQYPIQMTKAELSAKLGTKL